jgi:uncharacterized membrane protein YdbT with pleckstrin-like domain
VSDLTIKPTAKFLKAGTVVSVLVVLALEIECLTSWKEEVDKVGAWLMILPALLLLWPAARAMRRQLTTITLTADRLRLETGAISKTTRTVQLSKLQDVRVDQGLMQRIFGVGDLSIETAGQSSRESIHNVDNPHALADEIMNRAQKGATSG